MDVFLELGKREMTTWTPFYVIEKCLMKTMLSKVLTRDVNVRSITGYLPFVELDFKLDVSCHKLLHFFRLIKKLCNNFECVSLTVAIKVLKNFKKLAFKT